eukprot:274265_1
MATRQISKVKITVVGDEAVGKTCLLISYRSNSTQMIPSIFDAIQFNKTININNMEESVKIKLCDTSSEDQYQQLRIKSYKKVDICLVTFDILNINSLQNIGTKWIPEIQTNAPNCLIMLIGLKCDLRGKGHHAEIPIETIKEYQNTYNIIDYIETSALKKINIEKAFNIGIEKHLISSTNKHKQSDFSVANDEIDDVVPTSLTSIMNTHQKQWNQHLYSMGLDSNVSMLGTSAITNNTFPVNASMNSDLWQQQQYYRNNSTMSNNYNNNNMYNQQNVMLSPPPMNNKKNNNYKEPLLVTRTPMQEAKKITNSHVGSISIDYVLDDEQNNNKKKSSCCIVL